MCREIKDIRDFPYNRDFPDKQLQIYFFFYLSRYYQVLIAYASHFGIISAEATKSELDKKVELLYPMCIIIPGSANCGVSVKRIVKL